MVHRAVPGVDVVSQGENMLLPEVCGRGMIEYCVQVQVPVKVEFGHRGVTRPPH
jgi:hypothetical protein